MIDLDAIAARGYRNGAVGIKACALSDHAASDVPALVAEVERLSAYIQTRHAIEGRMRRGLYLIAEFPESAHEIAEEALGHVEDGQWLGADGRPA